MALIFADSFNHYATADITKKWNLNYSSSNAYISSGSPLRPGGGSYLQQVGGDITKMLGANYSTLIAGVRYRPSALSQGAVFGFAQDASTYFQCCVATNAGGGLELRRQLAGGTLIAASTKTLMVGASYYIEAKITIHPTAGSAIVKVNGETWISVTGVNTAYSGTTYASRFDIGQVGNAANGSYCDLYICDTSGSTNNDFLGDIRIDSLMPVADGNYQGFTNPVAGRAARYWRIYVTTSPGSTQLAAYEIQMRSSIGGANQCTSGTASADSIGSATNAAAKAFDGTTSTMWESSTGALPHWIAYDFGIGVTKEIVEIAWTASNYISETPTTLEVQYSDDGVTWATAWGATTPATWANGETRVFSRPTAAAHYWAVDDVPVFGDYLLGGAVGSKESLVLSDLPVTGTVLGVQVANLVAKTDAGLAKVKNLLRSGTTDALGPEMALSTSYLYNVSIHETDPATGAAWTKSAVDALEVGVQVTG